MAQCGVGCMRALSCWVMSCQVLQWMLRSEWMQDADENELLRELRSMPAFAEGCALQKIQQSSLWPAGPVRESLASSPPPVQVYHCLILATYQTESDLLSSTMNLCNPGSVRCGCCRRREALAVAAGFREGQMIWKCFLDTFGLQVISVHILLAVRI